MLPNYRIETETPYAHLFIIAGASTYKDVGIGPNQVLSATIEAKPVPSKDLVRITLSPTKILDLPAALHWHIIYYLYSNICFID